MLQIFQQVRNLYWNWCHGASGTQGLTQSQCDNIYGPGLLRFPGYTELSIGTPACILSKQRELKEAMGVRTNRPLGGWSGHEWKIFAEAGTI